MGEKKEFIKPSLELEVKAEVKGISKLEDNMNEVKSMAIAIKESGLGKVMVNLDTKDFGLYHANIKTVMNRQNAKDTAWNRNMFATKLISDFQFATRNAIDELIYWQKIHKNDWSKVWSSYNGGWKYNSKEAKEYSQEIAAIIRELRKIDV